MGNTQEEKDIRKPFTFGENWVKAANGGWTCDISEKGKKCKNLTNVVLLTPKELQRILAEVPDSSRSDKISRFILENGLGTFACLKHRPPKAA